MKLLTRIANLCGTDKGTVVSECHGYTEFYDDLFNRYSDEMKKQLQLL